MEESEKKQIFIQEDRFIAGLRNDDEEVIREIYTRMLPLVKNFIKKNKGNSDDAELIFSDAIYSIIIRLQANTLRVTTNFEGYLFTTCKNLWRKKLNKSEKQKVITYDIRNKYYDRDEQLDQILDLEKADLVRKYLQELSDNCKQLLDLFFSKMSGREIMEEMGYASENTVRQRIFKCKDKLGKLIRKDPRYGIIMGIV